MANRAVLDQFNTNPNDVILPGSYTKNLAALSSSTLTAAMDRLDQMNVPAVTADQWDLLGSTTYTSQAISYNLNIDTSKVYKTLQVIFWFQANTAPTNSGILFTFNNDSGAAAYSRGSYYLSYGYGATAPTVVTAGVTAASGMLTSNNAGLANSTGYGTATFSIANNSYKHCHSVFSAERSTPVQEFGQVYSRYSNTSTAISSIQFFSSSGTYTGYIKVYGMK